MSNVTNGNETTANATTDNDIIGAKEACEILGGISRFTLYERIKEGLLTPLPKPAGARRNPRLKLRRSDVRALAKTGVEPREANR